MEDRYGYILHYLHSPHVRAVRGKTDSMRWLYEISIG